MNITLFQPRYPYGKAQVYLPGGLMNLGSRLIKAGIAVSFTDLNLETFRSAAVRERLGQADVIGFSILGPVYIPIVINSIRQLRDGGYQQPILVGGQGVSRITEEDAQLWFGNLARVVVIRDDEQLKRELGLENLSSMAETSMVPMLKTLDPKIVNMYLEREFCLYLSQGCVFDCGFCAAAKKTREIYRSMESLREEVDYICSILAKTKQTLTAYLSNLDTLQTPAKLEIALRTIKRIADGYGVCVDLRGLATSAYTRLALRQDSEILIRLCSFGLRMLAYGADGANEDIWKLQKKQHNKIDDLDYVVKATQQAGMKAELLMVIGFPGEKSKHVINNIVFSFSHAWRGVAIRPYLAKQYTPGGFWPGKNDMADADDPRVVSLRNDPNLLTRLDYAMLASDQSHSDYWQRLRSNLSYMFIITVLTSLNRCPNRPLAVPRPGRRGLLARWINRVMPADR